MRLTRRISKLEEVVGARPRDCPACGQPSAIKIRCVEKEDDVPLPTCPVCNWHLDYDGTPLPKHVKIFVRGDH